MKNSMDSFREHYFKKGFTEGEAAGLKRGLEFAEWWASECDVFNGTVEEGFEYYKANVEGKQ